MAETVFYENNLFYYGFLLAGVLAASFSQVLLKKGAMRTWSSFIREYLNPWVIGGYFLLLGSTALNICGLRGLSFLNGPVMESFGYVFVLFLSRLFFGERITVSGLVTGQDIIAQLKGKELGSRLLLPCNMLKADEDVFLDDITVKEVSDALQVPVDIVKSSGQDLIDAMLGPA